jgi:hypothetical protein
MYAKATLEKATRKAISMDERKVKDKNKDFVVKDGTTLHSVKDLYGHLSVIKDEDFAHHVNEQRNDFAGWVETAVGDKFLAAAMRRAHDKSEMQRTLFMAMFR